MKKATMNKTRILTPLMLLIFVFVFTFCVSGVSAAPGDIVYVNGSGGNDSWDGLSATWTSGTNGPKLSIKNAIGTVNNGGTVNIADGCYTGDSNTGITIDKNMNIIGQNHAGAIINGTCTEWIFRIQSDIAVTIKDLILANNYAVNPGEGAIYNDGTLTVTGCNFINNSGCGLSGAIYNQGALTVTCSNFTGNEACAGGAICNIGFLNVTGCNFIDNKGYGVGDPGYIQRAAGAIYNEAVLDVTCSNFTGNTACTDGGAIYNNGILTVTCSDFINNLAYGDGGAIYNDYGGLCTVNSSQCAGNTPQNIYNNNEPYSVPDPDSDAGFGSFTDPGVTVKAASKTVGMMDTGLPLAGILLAVLMVLGGLSVPKRK